MALSCLTKPDVPDRGPLQPKQLACLPKLLYSWVQRLEGVAGFMAGESVPKSCTHKSNHFQFSEITVTATQADMVSKLFGCSGVLSGLLACGSKRKCFKDKYCCGAMLAPCPESKPDHIVAGHKGTSCPCSVGQILPYTYPQRADRTEQLACLPQLLLTSVSETVLWIGLGCREVIG